MGNGDNIYTFEDVQFITGGREWCVSQIYVNLRETSIPSVTVTVDPKHTPGDPMDPATKVSLMELAQWHRTAQEFALDRVESTLKLKVMKKGTLEQELDLQNWLLLEAGFSGYGNSLVLEMTIYHPAVKCAMAGSTLGNFAELEELKLSRLNASDVLEAYSKAIKRYTEMEVEITISETSGCGGPGMPDAAAMIQEFKTNLEEARQALEDHFEWEPSFYKDCSYTSFPMVSGPLAGREVHIAASVQAYVGGLADRTVWEVLAHNICSEFGLAVLPTYWEDKLRVSPLTPWAKYQLDIPSTDIAQVQLPGFERTPLRGITVQFRGVVAGTDYAVLNVGRDYSMEMVSENVVYTPDLSMEGTYSKLGIPGWLAGMNFIVGAEDGQNTSYSVIQGQQNAPTPANVAPGEQPKSQDPEAFQQWFKKYRCALYIFAHHAFLRAYRQSLQVSMVTKLLFEKDSRHVIPGEIIRVTSRGTQVFDFYITEVTHVISVQNSEARTELTGCYHRPPLIPGHGENTCNPMWE